MFRKSSLLCQTSNENYSFNLDLVACSANRREEDIYLQAIRFQTWLPCQMKFTEIQVKSFDKVPAKPGSQ